MIISDCLSIEVLYMDLGFQACSDHKAQSSINSFSLIS